MRFTKKMQFLCLILSICMCLGSWASPTSVATAGIFETDADNYTSVHDYSTVKFDKGFVFTGLSNNISIDLGFATNISGIYIGAWYKGNILNSFTGTDTVATTTTPNVEDGLVTFTSVNNTNELSKVLNGEYFNTGVIVGLAGMGFKASFSGYEDATRGTLDPGNLTVKDSSVNTVDTTGYSKTTTYDPKGYYLEREMTPEIVWGMNMNLGSIALKPYARLGVRIYNEKAFASKIVEESLGESTLTYPQSTDTITVNKSELVFMPKLGAEAVFENGSSASAYYSIEPYLYTGSYTDAEDASVKVKGYVDNYTTNHTVTETAADITTVDKTALETTEYWKLNQGLNLGYKIAKALGERVSVGAAANVYMGFNSDKVTDKETTTTVTNYDSKGPDLTSDTVTTKIETSADSITNTTEFSASPSLKAGITFAAVPNKLSVNFGYGVVFPKFTSTKKTELKPSVGAKTETTKVDGNGETTYSNVSVTTPARTESQTITTNWTTVSSTFTAGLCWDITENVKLDTNMTIPLTSSVMDILESNLTMAVSVKF